MRRLLAGCAALAAVALATVPVPAPSAVTGARRALGAAATSARSAPWWPSGTARVSAAPASRAVIAVAIALTPSVVSGVSISPEVGYEATLSARCDSGNGGARSCPVPDGTLAWRIDGAGMSPGNLTTVTHRLGRCTTAVAGRRPTARCSVRWPTDGDQWLTATYRAARASAFGHAQASATIEVDVRAPVDLAAGQAFAAYANAGPSAIEDCTFVAAADWLAVTDGRPPPTAAIVADYWRAERITHPGADVGLTAAQLFTAWRTRGIAGSTLTGTTPVPLPDVEVHLAAGQALLATAELPAGFPAGSHRTASHAFLVVGFSAHGPMVVTWGEEVQLTWARFDAWTTGVWAITATTP